jgi:hypothetical protein
MEVPAQVVAAIRDVVDDCAWARGVLDRAARLEWVSDLAAVYAMRLDRLARDVSGVARRAERADAAVTRLAFAP